MKNAHSGHVSFNIGHCEVCGGNRELMQHDLLSFHGCKDMYEEAASGESGYRDHAVWGNRVTVSI